MFLDKKERKEIVYNIARLENDVKSLRSIIGHNPSLIDGVIDPDVKPTGVYSEIESVRNLVLDTDRKLCDLIEYLGLEYEYPYAKKFSKKESD